MRLDPEEIAQGRDQAKLPVFRLLLAVQLVAAFFFGLGPFVAPETTAILFGYAGTEHFIYRIAGAAILGYAVAAALGLRAATWQRIRIPMVATCAFSAAAVLAALLTLLEGAPQATETGLGAAEPAMVFVILGAATLFTVVAAYWLVRNEGGRVVEDRPVDPSFRAVLTAGIIAAAGFGLGPLLFPRGFAELGGFDPSDAFIYRLAGAATLGYAVAGVLEIRAAWWRTIRVQNGAAIAFNGLSVIAAALYILSGGQSLIAVVILVAATLFTAALGSWHYRARG